MKMSSKKQALIAGTLLLTATGLITRVLGFFYRIFLSRTIGAEGLGIYNMVHPIFGICFALCAGSIQTAISQSVAAHVKKGRNIFHTGLTISLSTAVLLAILICRHAEFLAQYILMEPRCAPLLAYMALSVPCAAIHACINGYYYGMQKTRVPAFAQVVEQVIRIGAVFLLADILTSTGREITVQLAVAGHLIGEAASSLFTIISCQFFPPQKGKDDAAKVSPSSQTSNEQEHPADSRHLRQKSGFKNGAFSASLRETAAPLMVLALPLMGNRLVLNLLQTAEAIWIPSRLELSGLTNSEAFSIYGVLTGMALPFILFPSTIFNSLAVLLLPTVAEAQSDGNQHQISTTISMSLRYSMYVGILCIGIFTLFGNELGTSVFKDPNAGTFITILAWLCPFLYLATTMGSILNGLGHTSITFIQNVAALVVRLGFVLIGIPCFGILAYLWGMLASELLLALLNLWSIRRRVPFTWNAWDMIVKPAVFMGISIGIYLAAFSFADPFAAMPVFIRTSFHICFISCCYIGLLALAHINK